MSTINKSSGLISSLVNSSLVNYFTPFPLFKGIYSRIARLFQERRLKVNQTPAPLEEQVSGVKNTGKSIAKTDAIPKEGNKEVAGKLPIQIVHTQHSSVPVKTRAETSNMVSITNESGQVYNNGVYCGQKRSLPVPQSITIITEGDEQGHKEANSQREKFDQACREWDQRHKGNKSDQNNDPQITTSMPPEQGKLSPEERAETSSTNPISQRKENPQPLDVSLQPEPKKAKTPEEVRLQMIEQSSSPLVKTLWNGVPIHPRLRVRSIESQLDQNATFQPPISHKQVKQELPNTIQEDTDILTPAPRTPVQPGEFSNWFSKQNLEDPIISRLLLDIAKHNKQ